MTFVVEKFLTLVKENHFFPQVLATAPGRINLIGEHTDYNGGLALPAAIDRCTMFAFRKNEHTQGYTFWASDLNQSYATTSTNLRPLASGGWQNYLLGVLDAFKKQHSIEVGGFDCVFSGNVPLGSGMSSSASLTCAFAMGINELFDLQLDRHSLATVAQWAEHHYAGTKCGLMDQFASLMGQENKCLLINFKDNQIETVEANLANCEWLLFDTQVKHNLANSEYNKRRVECEEGLNIFKKYIHNINYISDISVPQLESLKNHIPEKIYKRCRYVITENERVRAAITCLKQQDAQGFGKLMFATHASLRDDYEVSCPELDFLVENALPHQQEIFGARMMGGGFGGCTLNLVKRGSSKGLFDKIAQKYTQKYGLKPNIYTLNLAEGAKAWQIF